MSRSLTLRPAFGLRGAWIEQKFFQEFFGGNGAFGSFDNAMGKQKVKPNNSFLAGGLLAGVHLNLCFNRHWSIYGDLAGSLLYGISHTHTKNQIPQALLLSFPRFLKGVGIE